MRLHVQKQPSRTYPSRRVASAPKFATWLLTLAAVAQPLPQGQEKPREKARDLTIKDVTKPLKASKPAIPRSYALVVGVAKYQNLSEKQNLHFSERDAESMYSILISPESGNFRAE